MAKLAISRPAVSLADEIQARLTEISDDEVKAETLLRSYQGLLQTDPPIENENLNVGANQSKLVELGKPVQSKRKVKCSDEELAETECPGEEVFGHVSSTVCGES